MFCLAYAGALLRLPGPFRFTANPSAAQPAATKEETVTCQFESFASAAWLNLRTRTPRVTNNTAACHRVPKKYCAMDSAMLQQCTDMKFT
eukprot:scaffold155130_cov32-Prasinocladus_malaysianus.AAC.1